jgi:hypothetical protein
MPRPGEHRSFLRARPEAPGEVADAEGVSYLTPKQAPALAGVATSTTRSWARAGHPAAADRHGGDRDRQLGQLSQAQLRIPPAWSRGIGRLPAEDGQVGREPEAFGERQHEPAGLDRSLGSLPADPLAAAQHGHDLGRLPGPGLKRLLGHLIYGGAAHDLSPHRPGHHRRPAVAPRRSPGPSVRAAAGGPHGRGAGSA